MRRLNLQNLLQQKELDVPLEWERDVRKHLMHFDSLQEVREQAKRNRVGDVTPDEDGQRPTALNSPPPARAVLKRCLIGFVKDHVVEGPSDNESQNRRQNRTCTLGDLQSTYRLNRLLRDTI